MQVNKNEKKASIRPKVRSLKIQPRCRQNKYDTVDVPEIRFSGNWLEELGFSKGKRVTITTMNELLILRLKRE
jgi:hypothetical protein